MEVLTAQGCTVQVSDLFTMKLKATATATAEDITGEVKDANHFRYIEETKQAWEEENCLLISQRNLFFSKLGYMKIKNEVNFIMFH